MFPDAIARDVGRCIRVFENNAPQRVEIVPIELRVAESLRPLLDEGIEIDVLLQVEKILAVLLVEAKKLAAHRAKQLLQHRFDERAKKPGILLRNRQHQAEIVSQLLGRRADRRVDVRRRQAVDRKRVNDPDSGGLVLWARERLLDARIEDTTAIDDLLDSGIRSERGIVSQHAPIGIVGDQSGVICRNVLIDDAPDRSAECLKHLTLLGDIYAFKCVEIGRVNREQTDKLFHPFVH